ncbi:hypothetical protein NKH77_21080 [Streptomyces sp. M19]
MAEGESLTEELAAGRLDAVLTPFMPAELFTPAAGSAICSPTTPPPSARTGPSTASSPASTWSPCAANWSTPTPRCPAPCSPPWRRPSAAGWSGGGCSPTPRPGCCANSPSPRCCSATTGCRTAPRTTPR